MMSPKIHVTEERTLLMDFCYKTNVYVITYCNAGELWQFVSEVTQIESFGFSLKKKANTTSDQGI